MSVFVDHYCVCIGFSSCGLLSQSNFAYKLVPENRSVGLTKGISKHCMGTLHSALQSRTDRNRIVIINSRFIECPQKRSRGNQLIHRRLTRTKSIGSGQNPESGRHTSMMDGGW